jgi:hypothetical protein
MTSWGANRGDFDDGDWVDSGVKAPLRRGMHLSSYLHSLRFAQFGLANVNWVSLPWQ